MGNSELLPNHHQLQRTFLEAERRGKQGRTRYSQGFFACFRMDFVVQVKLVFSFMACMN